METHGAPLAGVVQRRTGVRSELWWLPLRAQADADGWVAAALASWRERFGGPFAQEGEQWASEPRWMTKPERDAQAAIDALDARRREALAALDAEGAQLSERLAQARSAADESGRRLLTSGDRDLVDEVAAALRDIGFVVTDADALPEHQSQKQEDLRVRDAEWEAIAEVKGYAKRNAKTTDLLQIGRAAEHYAASQGRPADARWYVVNQSYATPPGQRQRPFVGAAADVAAFAALNGLVIDTRDLFVLREAVRDGVVSPEDARTLLRTSVGVFEAPPRPT